MSALGERIEAQAWARGDQRRRCEEGHVYCEGCGACACEDVSHDPTSFPAGVLRVTMDKRRRSLCRECRYSADQMGNF